MSNAVILAKHQPILQRKRGAIRGEMLEPRQMRATPVRAFAEHEAATGQELQDLVSRLENLALERFPRADDVAHPLLRLTRDAHDGELARPIEAGEIGRVAFVVFALYAGPFRDQRRRDHLAQIAPLPQCAVEDVPRSARLVTRALPRRARRGRASASGSAEHSATARAASAPLPRPAGPQS